VKTLFAILFSVLLLWTQSVVTMGATAARQPDCCKHGPCAATECCTQNTPSPTSQPVAPSSRTAQNESQLAVAVPGQLISQPVVLSAAISISLHSTSSTRASVPLFQRNCSFLI
jgi:hypothetical protein